jgi:DNA-binding CsgD family transcriptional regulator
LQDVESVCCSEDVPAARVLDLLSSLIDKSLVIKEQDAAGTASYRLHETMREYARLKLHQAGEEGAVESRCAEYYTARCLQFAAEGRYRLLQWLAWMELEIDNVRAVLRRYMDHAQFQRGIDLASYLTYYWITRATTEGVRWLDEFLARDGKPHAHARAYFSRGFLAVLQNDPSAAGPVLERGVAAARAAEQQDVLSRSLAMASIAASMAGDGTASRQMLEEARAIAVHLDDLGVTLMAHQAQALNGLVDGDVEAVTSAASEGARLSREAGDLYSLDMMLLNQGFAALLSGDLREAEQRFAEGLRIARQLDDRVAQCHLLGGLACCAAGSRAARLALREATPSDTGSNQASAGVLGEREADVARLVADGLSNKEIGARLFISERTVESHVRNILNKLGFNSRAQIASWMSSANR